MHVQGRAILRKLLLWCWLLVPVAGLAASGEEFYQRLYQRGMAHFAAADYAAAYTELRNAAFGFVEQVEQFEIAQSYACIAAHRLGRDHDARDSLMRIVTAEKVQPHFRSVQLPTDVRAEIHKLAAALLTDQEARLLGVGAETLSTAEAKPPVVVPTPTKQPNVAVTAPRSSGPDDDPPPASPKAAPPKKAKPQPVSPAPQPRKPVVPLPQPQPVIPVPQPRKPAPQPAAPSPQPVIPTPKLGTIKPQPQPAAPVPVPPAVKNAETSLAEAQRAVDDGDINRARSIYTALLNGPPLTHAAALRLAEGMYRVRDFPGAARAFARAGTISRGEERYHYYYAVALYETGRYGEAKRALAAALPYIELTADVARYRTKIEGAIE